MSEARPPIDSGLAPAEHVGSNGTNELYYPLDRLRSIEGCVLNLQELATGTNARGGLLRFGAPEHEPLSAGPQWRVESGLASFKHRSAR